MPTMHLLDAGLVESTCSSDAFCSGCLFSALSTLQFLHAIPYTAVLPADCTLSARHPTQQMPSHARTCLSRLLQGVIDMHEAGWAHLDLKPTNLILERQPGTAQLHPYLINYRSCLQPGSGIHLKQSMLMNPPLYLQQGGLLVFLYPLVGDHVAHCFK